MTTTVNSFEQAAFLGPGEGQALWFLRNRMVVKATAQSTGGAFGLLESLVAPGFSPPLHVHHREAAAAVRSAPRPARSCSCRAACRIPSSSKATRRRACSRC
jgi:hypothetical protein